VSTFISMGVNCDPAGTGSCADTGAGSGGEMLDILSSFRAAHCCSGCQPTI
jgi:hypothetical protein